MGKLASKGQPGVQYGKVDLRKNPHLGQEYNVRSIPDTRIFHNGEEIGSFVGSRDAASIETMVGQYLASVRPVGEVNPAASLEQNGQAVQPAIRLESNDKRLPPGITPL